jgi:hypothetical protein
VVPSARYAAGIDLESVRCCLHLQRADEAAAVDPAGHLALTVGTNVLPHATQPPDRHPALLLFVLAA